MRWFDLGTDLGEVCSLVQGHTREMLHEGGFDLGTDLGEVCSLGPGVR